MIFILDLIVNRSLERKNKLIDYFKQYRYRFYIKSVLIITCILEFLFSLNFDNVELFELKLLSSISKLVVYVSSLINYII